MIKYYVNMAKCLEKFYMQITKALDNYISIIDEYLYDEQRKIIKEAISKLRK